MKRMCSLYVVGMMMLSSLLAVGQESVSLPRPRAQGTVSFEEVISRSRTDRIYSSRPLRVADLSYVLWVAGGNRFPADAISSASRIYPSAAGIYPIRLYVLLANVQGLKSGIYKYDPVDHSLKLLREGDLRAKFTEGSVYAGSISLAPATVVIAGDADVMQRTFEERGRTLYLPLEAGLVAQTLRLSATALGLVVGTVGDFDPARIKDLLNTKLEPLVMLPLGFPYD